MGLAREMAQLAKVAALSTGLTLFIVNEMGMVAKVEGNSMQPTFNPETMKRLDQVNKFQNLTRNDMIQEIKDNTKQDRVILDKFSIVRDKTKLRIGDVVIFTSPRDPSKMLIKRIIAMPGDIIQSIETGEVMEIDQGHCWVEGDNQQSSFDSNNFGQIPLGLVQGRVCFLLWPFERMRKIHCDPEISSKSTKTIVLISR